MKKLNQIGIWLLVLTVLGFGYERARADSIVQATADSLGLQTVAPEELPPVGTFWLLTPGGINGCIMAPLPIPTFGYSTVYQAGDGQYIVDGTEGQISPTEQLLEAQASAIANLIYQIGGSGMVQMTMETDLPDLPGGSGGIPTDNYPYSINTNLLWLQLTNVSAGVGYANLYNATDHVYAIWATTNLLSSFTNWQVETVVWPTNATTNRLAFTVATLGRQNLFMRAQDWSGVDSDGDGVPNWWDWLYFNVPTLATHQYDFSGSGKTFWQDYSNNIVPTVFSYIGLVATNAYVNSSLATVQVVASGYPYFEAGTVDSTVFTNVTWNVYTSTNVIASLGSTEGWHNVWVGLRGHGDTPGAAVWQGQPIKLDLTPPGVTITSPTNGTVTVPAIQLFGYSSEPLSSIRYDVTNATGTLTNIVGYIVSQYFDTNQQAFTTNYFQCYNVPLTNGPNSISVHAADLAGNVTTITQTLTLNFTDDHTAPVLSSIWPTAGAVVMGNSFTAQAYIDDITAHVIATVGDGMGNNVSVLAIVEQDGAVSAQLPMLAFTNTLTLTAIDAAGNATTSNVTIYKRNVLVTIDPLTSDQLNQPAVDLTGVVSDPADTVVINGQPAYFWDYSGEFVVFGVPVSQTGTAHLLVQVFDTNSVLAGELKINLPQPAMILPVNFSQNLNWTNTGSAYHRVANWDIHRGGSFHYWGYSPSPVDGHRSPWDISGTIDTNIYLPNAWECGSYNAIFSTFTAAYSTQTKVVLVPPGSVPAGNTNVYLVFASANNFSYIDGRYAGVPDYYNSFEYYPLSGNIPLPPEWLQIDGRRLINTGITNTYDGGVWGCVLISALADVRPDVTPMATRLYDLNDYTFNVKASQLGLKIFDASGTDLTLHTNMVIVGQQMNLTCKFSVTNSFMTNYALTNFQWTVPGYAISNYFVPLDSSSAVVNTNFETNNPSVQFYWVDGGSNRIVQCSATINGVPVTGKAVFNVIRPSADWIGRLDGSTAVDTNYLGTLKLWLHLGNTYGPDDAIIRGITFTVTNFDLHGYPDNYDSLFSVQVLTNIVVEHCETNGTTVHHVSYGLDTIYPYANLNSALIPGSSDATFDSPGTTCSSDDAHAAYAGDFQMFLMFRPTDGIPIPLRKMSWNWDAAASSAGTTQWSLVRSNATIIVNNQDTLVFPQWSQNVTNYIVTTNSICN